MTSDVMYERLQSMTNTVHELVDAWDRGEAQPIEAAAALLRGVGIARLVIGGQSFDAASAQVDAEVAAIAPTGDAALELPLWAGPPPTSHDVRESWVAYAKSRGMDVDEADAATKVALMERYGAPPAAGTEG